MKAVFLGLGLIVLCVGELLFELKKQRVDPEPKKVAEHCLQLVRQIEGIELDGKQAKLVPIGAYAKGASYSGFMMVWGEAVSGVSVKCSIVFDPQRVKYFAVNGKDKTSLVRRKEQEK